MLKVRDYRSVIEAKLTALRDRASRLEEVLAVLGEVDREDGIVVETPPTVETPPANETESEMQPVSADDVSLIDTLRRAVLTSSRLVPTAQLIDEVSRNRPIKRQSVYVTLNRLKKSGEIDNVEGEGWASPDVADRERRFVSNEPEEVFDLADCAGWDIQHYKQHRLERAHLVALILHVRAGASDNGGGYTPAQADAVLQRLFRSAPTILDTVDAVLAGRDTPEGEPGRKDTTKSRQQSAAAGVRATRAKYGEKYRDVPWPE